MENIFLTLLYSFLIGIISGWIANMFYEKRSNGSDFIKNKIKKLLENRSNWRYEFEDAQIGDHWICTKDMRFKITLKSFGEWSGADWYKGKSDDPIPSLSEVQIFFNGALVRLQRDRIFFVSFDNGRTIILEAEERVSKKDDFFYIYDKKSLYFKIFKVVGRIYHEEKHHEIENFLKQDKRFNLKIV